MIGLLNKWRLFVFLTVLLAGYYSQAQNVLQVQGAAPNYYFTYKVQPRETLSGIGKVFNTSVGDIMRLNKMNTNSKLIAGQSIKIPLNAKNVGKESGSGSIELVHKVQKGESLYRISQNYNKVSVDLLKQWNNLKGNNLDVGKNLVIGYLLPNGNVDLSSATTAAAKPKEVTDAAKKTEDVVAKSVTIDTPSTTQDIISDTEKAKQQVPDTSVPEKAGKQPDAPVKNTAPNNTSVDGGEGFFATGFGYDVDGREMKVSSGEAMTFKTASGWTDKKYYILMNDIPPGSIVKISFNNKVIYAKVLWNLGSMKENEGLKYRISNAAASALGIIDPKFELNVLYYE
jgi:LysM repeat protein